MKHTQSIFKNAVVFFLITASCACSRAGIPEDKPEETPQTPGGSDSVGTNEDRLTRVGFELYPDVRWRYPVCDELKVAPNSGLEAPVMDGDLSDWEARSFRVSDPQGDDTEGRDLTSLSIDVASGGDLYLAIAAAQNMGDELTIELGVVSAVAESNYVERSLRYLRWFNGSLEWWQDGRWQSLPSNDLASAVGTSNVEVRLSRLFVGELFAYPAWWVKVSTRSGDVLHDVMSPAYLPGSMTGVDQRITVSACRVGESRLTLLRERAVSNEMADEFFRIARLAYGKFESAWGSARLEMSDAAFLIGGTDFSITRESIDTSPVQGENVAQIYALPRFFTDASDPMLRATLFRRIFTGLAARSFAAAAPGLSQELRSSIATAWSEPVTESEIGKHQKLAFYWDDVSGFLAGGDDAAKSKPQAWGHLLAPTLPGPSLQAAWQACQSCLVDGTYQENLLAELPADQKELLPKLWHGWRDDQPYDPSFDAILLQDPDGDGLPSFMEARLGTAPDAMDTDKDGWSDEAEWLFGSDGRNALVHPSTLSVDGMLGDWHDLMPTRIKPDPDHTTDECNGAGGIDDFVALADRDAIILAAKISEPLAGNVPVTFEVSFDFPEERRKFLLTAESGARKWIVQEEKAVAKVYAAPFVIGTQGFEVAFRASDFGLTRDLRDEMAVNMRIETSVMRTSRLHCDDTPWFRPLIRDNRP